MKPHAPRAVTGSYCAVGAAAGEGAVFGESPLSDAAPAALGLAGGVGGVCSDAIFTLFSPSKAAPSRRGGSGASEEAGSTAALASMGAMGADC